MSAETLRRAAALMRERAEAATPGPREYGTGDCCHMPGWTMGPAVNNVTAFMDTEGDAAHIASWHPAVALAVADLLDEIALRWEYVEERELALAVANAYLQESA